jgi:hypothetical protein
MSVHISELLPADIPQACALFERVFGHPITPAQWRWKYAAGPRLGSLNWVARHENGQLIGHVGATVFAGTAQGAAISMAQVCDIMVDPIARGGLTTRTVYPQLVHALQASLQDRFAQPYAYGFSGLRPYKLGHRLGFYQERQHCRPGYFVPQKTFDWRTTLWSIRQRNWPLPVLDALWARHRPLQASPAVQRTGAYLAWRYRDHPSHHYLLWVLSHLGRDQGWLITREMPNGHVCIVDALLPPKAKVQSLVQKLYQALNPNTPEVTAATQRPLYAWFLPNQDTPTPEPIIASEVVLGAWQTQHATPIFQPGDTDVF